MGPADLDSLAVKALLAGLSIVGGFVVRFLGNLAQEISKLNMSIAGIVERTEQHERRIGALEDRL